MDAEQIQRQIGWNIAAARREAGIQQGALADRIGVRPSTASKWETGREMPGIQALLRIAGALGVPLLTLLKGIDAQDDAYRAGYVDGWRDAVDRIGQTAREARTSPPWPEGGR